LSAFRKKRVKGTLQESQHTNVWEGGKLGGTGRKKKGRPCFPGQVTNKRGKYTHVLIMVEEVGETHLGNGGTIQPLGISDSLRGNRGLRARKKCLGHSRSLFTIQVHQKMRGEGRWKEGSGNFVLQSIKRLGW